MQRRKAYTALDAAIAKFVAHQRVFGRRYVHEEYALRAFGKFVVQAGADDITSNIFDRWSRSQIHLSPTTVHRRQLLVRKLCLFRRRKEPKCFVPDTSGFARPRPHPQPVIVTTEQVAAMLRAASALPPSQHNPLRAATLRISIVLLYTAGLRRGELLRLTLSDVDAGAGVIYIRESKFHRSRWVPLSSDAHRELRDYLVLRSRKPYDMQPTSPMLCNGSSAYGHSGWHAFCGGGFYAGMRDLFERAGVRDPQGRRPRVHDLRHSFAVHALARWYREGGDVQTHLPKLAMYMGHVSIVSTAYYINFVPEIADLASKRFAQSFSRFIDSDAS
jgi:integrase/recombinase XerD